MIDENLFVSLRQYIFTKTGINYFSRIKKLPNDIMISCPHHKNGQERKPSCGVKLTNDEHGTIGTVHCFTCGYTSNLDLMIQDILGTLYNENEVESMFHLKQLVGTYGIQQEVSPKFVIPKNDIVPEYILRAYRYYNTYLESRGITYETAQKYDIGFDSVNNHITFPIKTIENVCIGIGRRSIDYKKYIYPSNMIKPLYGVYELPKFINYLWVVEGPFNLWTLFQYHKSSVALLGTGTQTQYKDLLKIQCKGYVLALDGDQARNKWK